MLRPCKGALPSTVEKSAAIIPADAGRGKKSSPCRAPSLTRPIGEVSRARARAIQTLSSHTCASALPDISCSTIVSMPRPPSSTQDVSSKHLVAILSASRAPPYLAPSRSWWQSRQLHAQGGAVPDSLSHTLQPPSFTGLRLLARRKDRHPACRSHADKGVATTVA